MTVSRARSIKGFTLIEFLIVILFVGIIAAIAVPGLKKAQEADRRTQARTAKKVLAGEEVSLDELSGFFSRSLAKGSALEEAMKQEGISESDIGRFRSEEFRHVKFSKK